MDSNHDKVIQNHLCYRYTTRQNNYISMRHLLIIHRRFPKTLRMPTVLATNEKGVSPIAVPCKSIIGQFPKNDLKALVPCLGWV